MNNVTASTPSTAAVVLAQPENTPPPAEKSSSGRFVSVDALRGFDMFWIVGADAFVGAMNKLNPTNPVVHFVDTQLSHSEWEGFSFYDLIFPMFAFLVGVAIVFSLTRIVEREGKFSAYKRVFRRFVLLFIVGIIYYGGLSDYVWDMRFLGVLQRLALCYLFGSLLFMNLRVRGLIITAVTILIGYWALFTFVPVPADPALHAINPAWGVGGTSYAVGNNWAHYIDFNYLPGRRHDQYWDPEGLLSTVPAVVTTLLGIFAGLLLRNKTVPERKKALYLIGAGVAAVAIGYLWGFQFPIIKKIWNSTYVLVAGGYSSILLGVFYQVVDVWGYRKWATPFLWIGSNALTLYLAWRFVKFKDLAEYFTGGHVADFMGAYAPLLTVAVAMLMVILLARFLYKNKIFIRL
jgi:predicted acyltransferase